MNATPRQVQVLRALAEGWSLKEIAHQMGLSVKTVESHKATGMERLGIKDRVELVRYALKVGWLKSEGNCGIR